MLCGGRCHSAAGLLRENQVQNLTSWRNKHLVSHRTLIVLGEPGEYWDMWEVDLNSNTRIRAVARLVYGKRTMTSSGWPSPLYLGECLKNKQGTFQFTTVKYNTSVKSCLHLHQQVTTCAYMTVLTVNTTHSEGRFVHASNNNNMINVLLVRWLFFMFTCRDNSHKILDPVILTFIYPMIMCWVCMLAPHQPA